jgi:hypothetical protein
MRKFLTFISIVLLFLFFAPKQLNAQVVTEIDSITMCYNINTSIPVVVHNMNAVDTLRLVLSFDKSVIGFVEYFGVNEALSGGTFEVTSGNDSLIISWTRINSATIAQDTLVWFRFKGLTGSTALHWNTSGSYFHTAAGNIPAVFVDGKAVVDKKIDVILTELSPTCTRTCVANYQADGSGGTAPYKYLWNGKPSQYDFIKKYLCSGKNQISISDTWGCKLDSAYTITGLPGANVKLIIEGNEDTTIYLQNPVLTFSFQEVSPTHVVDPPLWEFGDGDTARSFNPTHIYARANQVTGQNPGYTMKLHIYNENGCDSIIEVRIPIRSAKLNIPGVITPNGDSFNEKFLIQNVNKIGSGEDIKITNEFQRMELVIFDRWGRKLYDDSNYKSDWEAKGVPDGSYYFILKTVGFYTTETHKGSITVLGSGITQ